MTLANFAGSLLLALTLASLSALAPPAPRPGQSLSYQSVGTPAVALRATPDTRLALAGARTFDRVTEAAEPPLAGSTVPNAGQIVPETGQ